MSRRHVTSQHNALTSFYNFWARILTRRAHCRRAHQHSGVFIHDFNTLLFRSGKSDGRTSPLTESFQEELKDLETKLQRVFIAHCLIVIPDQFAHPMPGTSHLNPGHVPFALNKSHRLAISVLDPEKSMTYQFVSTFYDTHFHSHN